MLVTDTYVPIPDFTVMIDFASNLNRSRALLVQERIRLAQRIESRPH